LNTGDKAIEMLPGDLKRIAEVAGLEAAVRIARAFRGTCLYVPGLDEVKRKARDAIIKSDYDSGMGVRQLVQKHGITERQVRRILKTYEWAALPDQLLAIIEEPES
jgi:Mor family transcriptional regulator